MMTSDQIIQLLVLVLGTGGIGGLIVGALREDWANRRQLQRQEQEERLAREHAEAAAREAAENFLNEQGRRRFEDLERRANKADEDRIAAQKQIDTLVENQRAGKLAREELERKNADLERRYDEREGDYNMQIGSLQNDLSHVSQELGNLKTAHEETLSQLKAQTDARLAAEEREKTARDENDTLKLEKTRLEKRIDDLQREINVLKEEVATLKNGHTGDTGPLNSLPPPS